MKTIGTTEASPSGKRDAIFYEKFFDSRVQAGQMEKRGHSKSVVPMGEEGLTTE